MPVTLLTIAVSVVMFVAWWLLGHTAALFPLVFTSGNWLSRPWSLVTYAYLETDFMGVLFGSLMAFFFMGSLERAWGKDRFLPAYGLFLLLPPIALWLAHLVTGREQTAMGLWLPTACWTVAYGAYRPQSVILVFGIAPVKAMWIAIFAGAAIVFYYGNRIPVAGLCAGLAPLAAWGLGRKRFSFGNFERNKNPFRDEFRKSLKTKRDTEAERLRLREILERSVHDDDEKPK
jgi:membrane associated rhomboid family serine protease